MCTKKKKWELGTTEYQVLPDCSMAD